ncbi:uncharacterized protein LOC133922531 isoform X1 [Phragmites australis]|uniref:uncharacterized protein LOC133922531 isoform X1 n=1 Tax=Phragmites australis TaxID=29695 RepID=UPI002D79CBC8|nr:uncharacterized protein LOC133922531 isoform X1 [Phragmites australis]
MAAADADADELAADIICSLRRANLAGWTPPWCKQAPSPSMEGELIWPAVARGKRSRRRSPSAGSAATASGKGRWARASPASPLDYSGGSGSGASTSGGEDGGFCSPGNRRAPATKVGYIGRPRLTFMTPAPRPTGQRPRKKIRLPEVQQLVRSLAVENESLREVINHSLLNSFREYYGPVLLIVRLSLDLAWLCMQEMRSLQRACNVLSKENDKLETRLAQSNTQNGITSKEQKGKQPFDQQSVTQSDSFALPDLNLPPQDTANVSSVH